MRQISDPAEAASALLDGHLAALPTETVYGLGARADRPPAIARVYATKGRPADHPLIVHIADTGGLDAWAARVPDYARALVDRFWPGPLTLVVERSARAGDFITGGQSTVAVRVPAHPVISEVLAILGELSGDHDIGVAAPSANRFGRVSPTTARHVVAELGDLLDAHDVVLDGGPSSIGLESTIIDCTGVRPVILRPGRVSREDVEQVTGLTVGTASAVRAPGMLASHYAPAARVRIVTTVEVAHQRAEVSAATVGLLALADVPTPTGVVRLSEPQDADEYARVLYAALREADALELTTVLAIPPPESGVGAAVRDRLARAAAGN